jgi:hypothetical protein
MLGDLARRRRAAQTQVEQLRVARDRLLSAYDVVRRTVDEATSELVAAEPEARLAAEAVARRSEALAVPAAPAVPAEERPLSLAATPVVRAPQPVPAPAGPVPPSALLRRMAEPAPPAPDRPPLRPQTVAGAVARHLPPPALAPPAAPPPAPPVAPPPLATPPPAPEPPELATGETPAVSVDPPPPASPSNGNGNGNGHDAGAPERTVEALFARIRADRVAPAAARPEPPAPEPPPAPVPVLDAIVAEHALSGRDDLLENVEAGLTRALKRMLQDEQNELLDRLRRTPAASADAVLPAADAQRGTYAEAALPWLQQAAGAGVGFVSDPSPGSEAERAHPPLGSQAAELAAELVAPLRDRLARALDDGDDPVAVAESLRAAYRQWKTHHVEETARHHVLRAFSVGSFAATPDAATVQWLVDEDGHCPDCDDNALAGATAKGQPFPTGQLHPPAHRGCRCLLVPAPA